MSNKNKGVYIPSIDGKDIFLANGVDKDKGFTLKMKNGCPNLRRYKNVFDYSLDLIELRKIAKVKYWGNKEDSLSFFEKGKEYCSKIINLTFKYPVKEFNKITTTKNNVKLTVYIKYPYKYDDLEFVDCVAIVDEEVVGVICEADVIRPQKISGFECVANKNKNDVVSLVYKKKSSKTIHNCKSIRERLYEEGFICDGVRYVRFKRSSGSARVGKCLFIAEELYDDMFKLAKCGLDITDGCDIDLASFEGYISLTTSSIIDTIEIEAKNILVIDDFNSVFKEEAIITEIGENNRLNTRQGDATVTNCIFDGQGLIDISLMGEYKDKGMLLLRNNFFKSCCFNTNIQAFFKDNNIIDVSQLNGFTLATNINDVKLITTPSSIKYYKFDKDVSKWLSNISSTFGIVKHDKDTHYFDGKLVQTHYQLINTLQFTREEMKQFLQPSLDYLDALNTDKHVMRNHIKWRCNEASKEELEDVGYNLATKNDVVYTMLGYNNGFENTKIYSDFKKDVRNSFIKNIKKGHVYINGTYAILFGNPYEMLLSSIGLFDGNPYMEVGTIHNTRYNDGEEILGCRSPHVTISNILLTKNKYYPNINTYFNLTSNIVCINSIKENTLERLSSADFDSDSMIITNDKLLVNLAKINYDVFKVPTSMVEAIKLQRKYTKEEMADLDIKTGNNKIGEIINLSQILNSILWDKLYALKKQDDIRGDADDNYEKIKDLFFDICQLDVMSCIEIDKAKKEFVVDTTRELSIIREKYDDYLKGDNDKQTKPKFFEFLAKSKGYYIKGNKNYIAHETAMDYLSDLMSKRGMCRYNLKEYTLFSNVFTPLNYDSASINKRQLKTIRDKCISYCNKIKAIWSNTISCSEEKRIETERLRGDLIYDVSELSINETTTFELIKTMDMEKYKEIKGILSYLLFQINNQSMTNLINCLEKDEETRLYSHFGVEFSA